MNTRISIPRFLALILVFLLTAGCKIRITVPDGGKVVSASHTYDCDSGETCVVEVNDFNFTEKFDAHAWEGWVFIGWKFGPGYLCGRSESVCHMSNKGLEQYDTIAAIVKSDEILFMEPEFVEGTPYDEALANVQDESLRDCLRRLPQPIRYAEQIREVNCTNPNWLVVDSVQGIEAFARIENLSLRGNASLTDLQPLSKLSRLQYLKFDFLLVESTYFNAAALGELKLLDYLHLTMPGLNPDWTEIGNLKRLKELKLSADNPDLSVIGSLVSLRKLDLSFNRYISDISPLAQMTKLETLNLSRNKISDISLIAGLTNLKYLTLRHNEISDISPLAGMTKLETLILSFNEISDISPLAGMTKLETLDLSRNKISDISPLAEIDSIPKLYLQSNVIQDANPLKQHYPLTLDPSFKVRLDLSINPISSIGDALDGIRTGAVGLVEVPLSCQEYSRLAERYDSRVIVADPFTYHNFELSPPADWPYWLPLTCL